MNSNMTAQAEFTTTVAPGNDSVGSQMGNFTRPGGVPTSGIVFTTFLAIICVVGLIGNGLVVFVITRYTKMKTVTNMYILNLSIADFFFLLGLPFAMMVTIHRAWLVGPAMCKIYFILTCVNWFTGTFTLVVMSADRFLAVCYPITSMKYRTPKYALCAIGLIWLVSFVAMLPVVLFATLIENPGRGTYTCNLKWPYDDDDDNSKGNKIFILYDFILSFVLPVALICIFYALLLLRLQTTGSQIKNSDRRRSHRKVTKLVSLIIAVFIFCWLPFWTFQVYNTFKSSVGLPPWGMILYFVFTVLSYANSMVNPLLYAFTNESFRESFISAFKCAADPILGGAGGGRRWSEYVSGNNNSVMPPHNNQLNLRPQTVHNEQNTDCEFTMLNSNSNSPAGNSIKQQDCIPEEEEKQKLTENHYDGKTN